MTNCTKNIDTKTIIQNVAQRATASMDTQYIVTKSIIMLNP